MSTSASTTTAAPPADDDKNNSPAARTAAKTTTTKELDTDERSHLTLPQWCPEQQIYIGANLPSHHSETDLTDLLRSHPNGSLRIFGYGSLCWNPGSPGDATLAKFDEGVTTTLGRAKGWRRCWAQRSADHRGTPSFPGLVCTLLSDEEVSSIRTSCIRSEDVVRKEVDVRPRRRGGGGLARGASSFSASSGIDDDEGGADKAGDASADDEEAVEVKDVHRTPSMTEGLIYEVPPHLVDDCLAELDFREKGGYARDVIDVVEDDTGRTVRALLYRGTPDNPAFWTRALLDLPYAAAVMAASIGPSGPNDAYLLHLDEFLADAATKSTDAARALFEDHTGDEDTRLLASTVRQIQRKNMTPYFLVGAGSDQHGQLLLRPSLPPPLSREDEAEKEEGREKRRGRINAAGLVNGDEAHELKEIAFVAPLSAARYRRRQPTAVEGTNEAEAEEEAYSKPKRLYAGGGHSALLTKGGDLYLWGWNESGQLGRLNDVGGDSNIGGIDVEKGDSIGSVESHVSSSSLTSPPPHLPPVVNPLWDIAVETAALGHAHTLVIERRTGRLFAFGDNGRGQVDGVAPDTKGGGSTIHFTPVTLGALDDIRFTDVAAGLFHSAAVADDGSLVTWGCGRFNQALPRPAVDRDAAMVTSDDRGGTATVGRWRPDDGARIVRVACGRRHTVLLDNRGRVWTMGDNKYGQLGRDSGGEGAAGGSESEAFPKLVEGPLGRDGSGCRDICCGWSHNVALVGVDDGDDGSAVLMYGWGRNDKGQLGTGSIGVIRTPQLLHKTIGDDKRLLRSVCCGAESSMALDVEGMMWGCGWNEHGNVSAGHAHEAVLDFTRVVGARVTAPPPDDATGQKIMAAGGAHFLAMIS